MGSGKNSVVMRRVARFSGDDGRYDSHAVFANEFPEFSKEHRLRMLGEERTIATRQRIAFGANVRSFREGDFIRPKRRFGIGEPQLQSFDMGFV